MGLEGDAGLSRVACWGQGPIEFIRALEACQESQSSGADLHINDIS